MSKRDELDAIAWQTIKSAKVYSPSQTKLRPRNYAEIAEQLRAGRDFELAWSDFLHDFYAHRHASYFEYRPPTELSREWQAVLAGAAEWLSAEFDLPKPAWVDEPDFFLDRPWDPWEDLGLDEPEIRHKTLKRSPEAFRKRNLAFESRNLIAL